ncbi:hypothetical protein HPC49_48350 [Pyxidicoccus fallax]|uniref:Wnt family protein n=1 Tax=Pyxidicoccus fallax TaxID=394095 RepID=A0A848LPN3_9BACT|nr:hypothetical protein [Pyxidicoccus fallax]NMO19629.1 wnt family protein [Pyxidicoccus fallax]NPC85984.1 hypothetical protein [Pyxidicoccus fallax]
MSMNVRGGDSVTKILQRVSNAVKDIAKPAPAPQAASTGQSGQAQTRVPGWDGTSSFQAGPARGANPATPAPTASRPDLGQIQRDYQVKDDETTKWSPKGLGFIPIPFAPEAEVTKTEAKMLDQLSVSQGLYGLKKLNDIKEKAFAEADRLYPTPGSVPGNIPEDRRGEWVGNDGHRDAFRHAYWNALMTREFGADWTKQFATAHEALPGNPATREAMDLYNNEVGRQIAIDNPNASPEELATLVQQAVTDGKTVVLDSSGQLQWSDRVAYGQHGLTDGTPGNGGQDVPDGSASAR